MNWNLPRPFVVAAALLLSAAARADVVINEIMYQPAGVPENTAGEFIELHNTGAGAVNLSGWKLSKGVDFTFPAGTTIPAGGFLVVVPNVSAHSGVPNVIGYWTGTLSNSSEVIRLVDAAGETQDEVKYADEGDWGQRVREATYGGWDWSSAAVGGGRSLELRNAAIENDNGQAWGSSAGAGGTPGAANSIAATDIAPIIGKVRHFPAVPKSTDTITISCELADESAAAALTATLFWRAGAGSFQAVAMAGDGGGDFTAILSPKANLTIVEFYIQASDGASTRTWPAPTSEGQNANCQLQVDNEVINGSDSYYRLILTAAENAAFEALATMPTSDRQFNATLVVTRGSETTIRYRASMRIRGNSSRYYQFKPLRIALPSDTPWDGVTAFCLNPRSSHLQFLGSRLMQAAGLRGEDTVPVELRRNGLESTTSAGMTPDFGKWVRVEDFGGEIIDAHWPLANDGNAYKKRRPDRYWRNTGWIVPANANGTIDGWSKQNNAAANDWSDLTAFFAKVQSVTAPRFPGAVSGDSASSTGNPLTGNGSWNSTALTEAEVTQLQTVADLDQWARWFAVMTIIQDIETNISNGEDDDYSIYFVPSPGGQRRAQLVAHDLDTILGGGDTAASYNARGLYDMCETGSVFRPLLPLFGTSTVAGNAGFRTKYLTAIRELYGSVFGTTAFNAFVDNHLSGWAPAATISSIKTFAQSRQSYLLGLAGTAITPPAATSTSSFSSAHGALMISEVLANNVSAVSVGSVYPAIIELHNSGGTPTDLGGMSITDDLAVPRKFVIPTGTSIEAGGFVALYGEGAPVGSPLPFSPRIGGGTIYFHNSPANGGALIDSITFGPQPADFSIGRTGPTLTSWALCTPSIGAANSAVTSFGTTSQISLNEWLGNPDYQFDDDFLELRNTSTLPVALGGMSITDDFINYPAQHSLPPLSFIGPSSFLRMTAKGGDATPGDATELPFRIDGTFGWLALIGVNGTILDRVDIISQPADTSTGRNPSNPTSFIRFGLPGAIATPGRNNSTTANVLALMNGLRVTEILFKPDNLEFVELQNIGATALDLSGVHFTKGITYTFGAASLAPGAFIVICKDRAAFQNQFGAGVPLADGQFTGSLSNSGERLAFRPPAPWDANILNFEYDADWYPATASNRSLTINDPHATAPGDWDEKAAWSASSAALGTPGHSGPPTITSATSASGILGDAFQYQISATKFPTSYDAAPLPAGLSLNPATGLISGTPAAVGTVEVSITATNAIGSDTKVVTMTVASSGPLAAFAWDSIASPQRANVPFPVKLRAVDAEGRTVESFAGTVNLRGPNITNPNPTVGTGTTTWSFPFYPYYHDVRTQVIYLASELGGPVRITALALDLTNTPGQVLQNWTIRMKHTALASYPVSSWEGPASGWTTVLQQNQTISATGWVTFAFSTPFYYDGTSNLMIDFSFNHSAYGGGVIGYCRYTSTSGSRTLYGYSDSAAGDPLSWSGTGPPTAFGLARMLNLKLTVDLQTVPIAPVVSGAFVNGVWSGNIAAAQTSTNVIVRADDGAGRSGASNLFDLVEPPPEILAPATALSVVGQPCSWQIVATNAPASFNAENLPAGLSVDPGSGLISGTPAAAGSSAVNLSATNSGGTGNAALSWQVQADSDGDGIGDSWESAFGLDPESATDGALDKDGDGQSNAAEWLAGTAPDDANSRLAIIDQAVFGGDVRLTWRAVAGKRYRVSARADLATGSWIELTASPIVATGATATWTHAGGLAGGSRYYRVELAP